MIIIKACGVIVEYNPFHLGHLYHLRETKKRYPDHAIIAVMSGDFVQRGEPAIIDKYSRAELALEAGVDIVLELPYFYATQSAELFARGAIMTLNAIGVSSIVFGSEKNDADHLKKMLSIEEDKVFKEVIVEELKKGFSYPRAYNTALESISQNAGIDLVLESNDILGLEYLRSIKITKSTITTSTIKRRGNSYNEEDIGSSFASATSIRKVVLESGIDSIKGFVPSLTFEYLLDKSKVVLKDFYPLLRYSLLRGDPLEDIQDISGELINTFKKAAKLNKAFDGFFGAVTSKNYTNSRVRRVIIHIILGLTKKDTLYLKENLPFIKVLGFSKKGRDYLNFHKKSFCEKEIPIVMTNKNITKKLAKDSLYYYNLNLNASRIYQIINPYQEQNIPIMKKGVNMKEKLRLPLNIQILYGIGVSYAIVDQIFAQWLLYYYVPSKGSGLEGFLSPFYVTLALVLSRFADMISDPVVGFLSDRFESKWGRRIPFIAFGSIPLGIATVALFFPLKTSEMAGFLYLTGVGATFFVFYTIVGAPYNSLIPEIGHTGEERLKLSTWQSIFRLLYTAIAMILPGVLIAFFSNMRGGDTEFGVRAMVIVLSIMASTFAYVTVFFVPEKKYSHGKKSDINLKESLKILFQNRTFIFYLIGLLFFFIGFNTVRASLNYYVEDIMGGSKKSITIASAILFGSSALAFKPTTELAKKYGYRRITLFSLVALCLLSVALFFLGRGVPVELGYLLFGLIGIPLAGVGFIFPPAMLGDLSTKISQDSNENIEGMCFGIQGFFLKMAFLVSIAVLPALLVSGGDGPLLESLFTPPEAVEKLGIYRTSLVPIICFIISFCFYFLYKDPILKKEN